MKCATMLCNMVHIIVIWFKILTLSYNTILMLDLFLNCLGNDELPISFCFIFGHAFSFGRYNLQKGNQLLLRYAPSCVS